MTTKKKTIKGGKEGDRAQGGGSLGNGQQKLGRGRQSSRRRIIRKWTTKTKKKVVELKEMITGKGMTKIEKRATKIKEMITRKGMTKITKKAII
jgi:hypothetical protein